ncbi:MAG TPA: SCO family protein [Casimicrobiaceae bacterium]|nr:SCO family protein [Casimicrobiaceae bacterium]
MPCYSRERALAFVALIALAAVAIPAAALDYDTAMRQSRAAIGRTPDDHAFTDVNGRRVQLAHFRGKPLLVSFVYTGCGQVCPTTTRFLDGVVQQANAAFGADRFNIATIGFNLPFDNAAAMRQFAKHQGIDRAQWAFLSPDAGGVDRLAADFGFAFEASTGGFDHVTQLSVVDANGRIVQQLYGESFDARLLVVALRSAADGTASPVQDLSDLVMRVRILCTVYDPRTGTYRADYGLFVEIFAGLTVLGATLHYLLREWRRQRHAV